MSDVSNVLLIPGTDGSCVMELLKHGYQHNCLEYIVSKVSINLILYTRGGHMRLFEGLFMALDKSKYPEFKRLLVELFQYSE